MKRFLRYFLLFVVMLTAMDTLLAQTQSFKELHKVKRKETIFGIARDNGLTVEELIKANLEMNQPGYELKKGDYIRIPFPAAQLPAAQPSGNTQEISMPTKPEVKKKDLRHREIHIGIMLPLHNDNGDGRRMTEYYRGLLMACDSLRVNGISTDIRAWNVAEDTDVNTILDDPNAAELDVIIGPLYSKQVKPMADFALQHDIRLFIPFSITTADLYTNANLMQVFQNGTMLNEAYVGEFCRRFKGCHPVIIDCNDSTSTKGPFTTMLRRRLEQDGVTYSITNLRSSEGMFLKSFSLTQPNVVVLNTSRSSELNVAFAKLNGMLATNSQVKVSMFGYPEWLMYTRQHLDHYYKFDTYIPSTYYMNPLSPRTEHFKQKYRWNFHQDMQNYHARYAVTGFDHAFFLLKGLHLYGTKFTGASGMVGYTALQTPLHFERLEGGGLLNHAMLLVHYTKQNSVETISF